MSVVRPSSVCPEQMMGSKSRMQGKVLSEHSPTAPVYVGIDVCKDWLDIHILPTCEARRLGNDKDGIRQLKRMLIKQPPACIVMEATGKFHRAAYRSLAADGLAVAIIDPYRARLYAGYCGYVAKTDRLDARLLALIAQSGTARPQSPPSAEIETLKELVQARSASQAELTALKNRLAAAEAAVLRAELKRLLPVLERHIGRLDEQIAALIKADADMRRKVEILTSIPGIGAITAYALVAGLSELGQCSNKQAAMLAGLAPIANDSGARNGPRSIRGGRPAPRQALYMASLSARRHNPPLTRFATALEKAGKPPKVILVAVMRKLVVLANTLITQNRPWSPNAP
jgi:transposase